MIREILYLVAEDAYGSGCGDFVGAEPDCGQAGWDAKDEDLGYGADRLARHEHTEAVRRHRRALDPSA